MYTNSLTWNSISCSTGEDFSWSLDTLEYTHPLERLYSALLKWYSQLAKQTSFWRPSSCNFSSSAPGDAVKCYSTCPCPSPSRGLEAVHIRWASCYQEISRSVIKDTEVMTVERAMSFDPKLRPFGHLTAVSQLCVQHLWPLINHLGLCLHRKAHRAWCINKIKMQKYPYVTRFPTAGSRT